MRLTLFLHQDIILGTYVFMTSKGCLMRTLVLVLLNCLLGTSLTAQAGVVSMDLETAGDGLLTYDTIDKREWLDLPETGGVRLSEVLAQMEPGGRLEGFQFATLEDVSALAASAGVGWMEPWYLTGNFGPKPNDLINHLGSVVHVSGGILSDLRFSFGLIAAGTADGLAFFDDTNFYVFSSYSNPVPGSVNSPIFQEPSGGVFTSGAIGSFIFPFDVPTSIGIGDIGPFWLYRAVPEPGGVVLLSMCAAWPILARLRFATPRG